MAAPSTALVADLRLLQRVFGFYKRANGANLPAGCVQLQLVDEDDLTNWFVQLRYVDENNADFFVSLRLCFLSSGASSMSSFSSPSSPSSSSSSPCGAVPVVLTARMPLVFVIAPRLVASFIHHGAICSLELMSSAWVLTPSNMTLLLLALYDTLNPFVRGSRVSVDDAERGRARRAVAAADAGRVESTAVVEEHNAYTEDEHAYGIAYIRKAHPHLFRSAATNAPAAANHPHEEDEDDEEGEEGTVHSMDSAQVRVTAVPAVAEPASPPLVPSDETCDAGVTGEKAARPPAPTRTRAVATFSEVRDMVLTALADATAATTASASVLAIQIEGAALADQPNESSAPATATPQPGTDPHVAFLDGTAPLDIYASTAWSSASLDEGMDSEGRGPSQGLAALRAAAEIPLARRRCINHRPQRLCPLWIPTQLEDRDSPHSSNGLHSETWTSTEANSVAEGAIAVERLVGDPNAHSAPALSVTDGVQLRIRGPSHQGAHTGLELALCFWNVASGETDGHAWRPLPAPSSLSLLPTVPSSTDAAPGRSKRRRQTPQHVSVPSCTVPAGLTLVLEDLYLYGHVRVLGSVELVRCTFVGSLVVEDAGQVALRETHLAVCTEEHLFWSCAPFGGEQQEPAGKTSMAQMVLRVPDRGESEDSSPDHTNGNSNNSNTSTGPTTVAMVVFGPWADVHASEGDDSIRPETAAQPIALAAAAVGVDGEVPAVGVPEDRIPSERRPPQPSTRREGILVLDSAAVELDVGTRVSRLLSLPVPVCVLAASELAARRALSSASAAAVRGQAMVPVAAPDEGSWLGIVCAQSGAVSAVPLSAPRVPVLRAFVLVSNQGRLRVLGAHLNPGVGAERCIFAEQDAMVDVLNSTIFTGIHSGVSIQGCRSHLEAVLIIGTAVRTPASALTAARPGDGLPVLATSEARCAGLNVELGGILTARFCVTRHVFFGFSVIAHSVAHFDGCHAEDVMNGFTIDASTATLYNCSAQTNHVGVFVLHQAKCAISDDRWGAFARRVAHLAESWHRGREAVEAKQRADSTDAERRTGVDHNQSQTCEKEASQTSHHHHLNNNNNNDTATTRNTKRSSWWRAAEAIPAVYDVLPREQADDAYMSAMSQLFGAHLYRASLVRPVGRLDRMARADASTAQPLSSQSSSSSARGEAVARAPEEDDDEERNHDLARHSRADAAPPNPPPLRGGPLHDDDEATEAEAEEAGDVMRPHFLTELQEGPISGEAVGANGLRVTCAFIGGRFGLEVRGAVVEATGLTFLDATEAAVYAYEGSSVSLSDTLIWTSPLQAQTFRAQRAASEDLGLAPAPDGGGGGGDAEVNDEVPDNGAEHDKGQAVEAREQRVRADQQNEARSPLSREESDTPVAAPRPPPPPEAAPSSQPASPPPPPRSCGVKLVAAVGTLSQCLTVQCAFGFAAVRGATVTADTCMALRGLNGFTIDAASCELVHCGADTDQVAVFVLNRGAATLTGTPHQSGLSSAQRPLPRLVCGGFPALYAGRLYGIETQSSDLTATGVLVSRGADSGFNLHSHSHVVLRKCLVSLSPEDVRQFILKQSRPSRDARRTASSQTHCPDTPADGVDSKSSTDRDSSPAGRLPGVSERTYEETMAQVAVLSPPVSRTDNRCTGVKVWAASRCQAEEVEVRCAVFAYAAMGPDSSLEAHHCVARHVINGFIVDSASAVLTKCSASCSHVGVSVFSNGRCVLRRGTYTSKRHGVESRGGVLQLHGHVKVFGFELVGVLLREQAHLSADRASFLEVKAARPSTTATATARSSVADEHGHEGSEAADSVPQDLVELLAPSAPVPQGEPALFPVCLAIECATAHIHQGDLGGGAACGVRCHSQGQLFMRLTRIANCTVVGLDVLDGGHVQLRSCAVQCLGRYAVVVRAGGELRVSRARDDDPAASLEEGPHAVANTLTRTSRPEEGRHGELHGLRAWWHAGWEWIGHVVPLPSHHHDDETDHQAAARSPTRGRPLRSHNRPDQELASELTTAASSQSTTVYNNSSSSTSSAGITASRLPRLALSRATGGSKLAAFLQQQQQQQQQQQSPAERRPPTAWLAWLESVEPETTIRQPLWWYQEGHESKSATEEEEHKQQQQQQQQEVEAGEGCSDLSGTEARDQRAGTTSETAGHHRSYESTILTVHNHQEEPRRGAGSDSEDQMANGSRDAHDEATTRQDRPSHRESSFLAAMLSRLAWWRRHRNRFASVNGSGGHASSGGSAALAGLVRQSLGMMPGVTFDMTHSPAPDDGGEASVEQGGEMEDSVNEEANASSLWLQHGGWQASASCVAFSTRTGVCTSDTVSGPAHTAARVSPLPQEESPTRPTTTATAALPSLPRWFVGVSGAVFTHGLCVFERVVLQPSCILPPSSPLSESLPTRRVTEVMRAADSAATTGTPPRQTVEAEQSAPTVALSPAMPSLHRARRRVTPGESPPQRPARPPPTAFDVPFSPAPIATSRPPAAMVVTGTLRLTECLLLAPVGARGRSGRPSSTEAAVGLIHAVGPSAHTRLEHVHVARQQAPVHSLPGTHLALEVESVRAMGEHGRQGREWWAWLPVPVPPPQRPAPSRSQTRAEVVPRWDDCVLLHVEGGATGYVRDVRALPAYVVNSHHALPSPATSAPDVVLDLSTPLSPEEVVLNRHDRHDSRPSTTYYLPPFSGALKLSVVCDGYPASLSLAAAEASRSSTVVEGSQAARLVASAADRHGPHRRGSRTASLPWWWPDAEATPLSFLAVSFCSLSHVRAAGPSARVYLCASVVAGGTAQAEPATAVVTAEDDARILDWGCLFANSHAHPCHLN